MKNSLCTVNVGTWAFPPPQPAVELRGGDTIAIGLDEYGRPKVRNLSGERRAQIDEAVRIAARRRYRQCGVGAERSMLRKMVLHNHVFPGMAYEFSKAWRDMQARRERA